PCSSLLFASSPALPHLHSFPTRRSSDLAANGFVAAQVEVSGVFTHLPLGGLGKPGPGWAFDCTDLSGLCTAGGHGHIAVPLPLLDRKSTRLNSSHVSISYAVFCLKKKTE